MEKLVEKSIYLRQNQKYRYPVEGEGVALSGIGTPSYFDRFTVSGYEKATIGRKEQWVIGATEKLWNLSEVRRFRF